MLKKEADDDVYKAILNNDVFEVEEDTLEILKHQTTEKIE